MTNTTNMKPLTGDNLDDANELAASFSLELKRRNRIGEGPVVYICYDDGSRATAFGPDADPSVLDLCEELEALGYDTSEIR